MSQLNVLAILGDYAGWSDNSNILCLIMGELDIFAIGTYDS